MANYLACLLAVALIGSHQSSAQKVDPSMACAGYEISVEKAKNCDGVKSLIAVNNGNITLLDNCTLVPSGSAEYKDFATAKLDYDLNFASAAIIKTFFPVLPLSSKNVDACSLSGMLLPNFKKQLSDVGLPTSCPVKGKKLVADNDRTNVHILHEEARHVNIRPYLAMAVKTGRTTGRINVVHDTGVTCFEFAGAVRRKATDALMKKAQGQFNDLKNKVLRMGGKKPTA